MPSATDSGRTRTHGYRDGYCSYPLPPFLNFRYCGGQTKVQYSSIHYRREYHRHRTQCNAVNESCRTRARFNLCDAAYVVRSVNGFDDTIWVHLSFVTTRCLVCIRTLRCDHIRKNMGEKMLFQNLQAADLSSVYIMSEERITMSCLRKHFVQTSPLLSTVNIYLSASLLPFHAVHTDTVNILLFLSTPPFFVDYLHCGLYLSLSLFLSLSLSLSLTLSLS
jgi:hypothetical protein